jgi:general nucleoside transport system permease protein
VRLEPKPPPSIAVTLLYPVAAIVLTLAITALLVLAAGASPFSVFYLVWRGAAGSQFALLETLTRATPLIFTGLAVAVAFRAKLWNIGAEAQLYIGGVVTVVLGTGALPLPSFLLIPIIMIVAMAAGALLLLGPAVLKTRFGVDEVVTTLLLNFIVLLFVSMLLEGPLKDPMGLGWPQSPKIIADARLPRIIQGKRLHYGFVIALVSAVIVWIVMKKTVLGYEMRAVGHNPQAASFAGIPVNTVLMKTALLSGGLAALSLVERRSCTSK